MEKSLHRTCIIVDKKMLLFIHCIMVMTTPIGIFCCLPSILVVHSELYVTIVNNSYKISARKIKDSITYSTASWECKFRHSELLSPFQTKMKKKEEGKENVFLSNHMISQRLETS